VNPPQDNILQSLLNQPYNVADSPYYFGKFLQYMMQYTINILSPLFVTANTEPLFVTANTEKEKVKGDVNMQSVMYTCDVK
jgi:hypothetical protein